MHAPGPGSHVVCCDLPLSEWRVEWDDPPLRAPSKHVSQFGPRDRLFRPEALPVVDDDHSPTAVPSTDVDITVTTVNPRGFGT